MWMMPVTRACGCKETHVVETDKDRTEVDQLRYSECDECIREKEVCLIKWARYKRDGSGDLEWFQMSVIGRNKALSLVYKYNTCGKADDESAHILKR